MTVCRLLAAVCFCVLFVRPGEAADWPHWRGADGSGVIAEESGWSGSGWPAGGEAWRTRVGTGSSSPVVAEGKLYITGWQNNRETVFCLDAAGGGQIWKVDYACPKYGRLATGDQGLYAGSTSTPAFDLETKRLYTLSTDGDINCWDTEAKGKRVWSFNLYDRYKVKRRPDVGRRSQRDYGYTSSPLIYKNWAIVEVGDDEGTVMAFEKNTGKRVWASEAKDEAGHTASPVLMTVEGVPCLAVLTLRNLLVMRLDPGREGKTVATYPWATHYANNIATPAVYGDSVLITSAYNHYAMCRLKITLKGATKIWQNENPSGVCSPVVYKDRIYWAWRGVHCVDFKTGRELWRGGRVGSAGSCLITKDERLVVCADNGDLLLAETAERSPKKYTELASRRRLFRTDAWPHVVLAEGRIYAKDRDGNLVCFALKANRATAARTSPAPKTSVVGDMPKESIKSLDDWPGDEGLLLAWKRGQKDKVVSPDGSVSISPRNSAGWDAKGAMKLSGGAFVVQGADRILLDGCKQTNRLSIEAEITSSQARQTGPARIVTFSTDGYSRNFTLAQEGDQLVLRLRTPKTGENGINPETKLARLPANKAVHVVVTYAPGKLACYLDGKLVHETDKVQGDFRNWSGQHLLFGNEWDGGNVRDWRGTISRVALFNRWIGPKEAARRFELAVDGRR